MSEHVIFHEDFTGEICNAVDAYSNMINEITTVGGWTPFWREGDGYLRPEMHVIDASNPNYLEPVPRLNSASRGIKIFKQWSVMDAGYCRQIVVSAGITMIQASLQGHCWYSQADDPTKSVYKCGDSLCAVTEGMRLWIGIDAAGGTDPWADSIEWSYQNIYDAHGYVYLSLVDPGPLVTVFIRADNDYGFLHADAYFANVELVGYSDDEPEPCRGAPREQYARAVNVVPQDATQERYLDIAEIAWVRGRQTVTGSYDDAGIGDLDDRTAVLWDIDEADRSLYRAFYAAAYPGTRLVFDGDGVPESEPPEPEPESPDPGWRPHNYVPTGIKLGFHAAGDGGQTGDVFAPLTPLGAQPPTAKVIVSLGAARDIKMIDPTVKTIGRIIDAPGYANVEGFDYNGDSFAQADRRMRIVSEAFGPYWRSYDYIEVINEIKPPSPEAHIKLAEFFKRCMWIIENWGWSSRIALFSHSTGTPEPADWDAIADTGVFEMAATGGHAISLHEYNLNSGGGHLYRYRDLYERIILPRRLDIPLYISEYNVDVADAGNADLMFANWTAYDAEVSRDPYMAGAHIYSTGEVDSDYRPTIYSLWDRYRAYAIAVRDRING